MPQRRAGGQSQDLLGAELRVHVEQAEPVDLRPRSALDTLRVRDGATEHLEAAADPQHGATRGGVPQHGIGQASLAQPGEVGDRGPGPGQHHEVDAVEVMGLRREDEVDPGLDAESVDVGEVADAGQADDRDAQGVVG